MVGERSVATDEGSIDPDSSEVATACGNERKGDCDKQGSEWQQVKARRVAEISAVPFAERGRMASSKNEGSSVERSGATTDGAHVRLLALRARESFAAATAEVLRHAQPPPTSVGIQMPNSCS